MTLLEVLQSSTKLGQGSALSRAINKSISFTANSGVDTDFIRVSGLYYMCPRQFVLNYWRPSPEYSTFTPDAIVKMQIGTDLHSFLQDKVLGPAGILWGKWHNGEEVVEGFHPEPVETYEFLQRGGRTPRWTFVEPEFYDLKHRLKGHCDGRISKTRLQAFLQIKSVHSVREILSIPPGPLSHTEIKTTTDVEKVADVPPWYRMQSSVYQWLDEAHESTFIFLDRATCEIKTLNYEYEQSVVDEALHKCRIIWEAIRDETMPEAFMKCRKPSDKRAKTCSHAKDCWSDVNYKKWIQQAKKDGKKNGRKFLDLSSISF